MHDLNTIHGSCVLQFQMKDLGNKGWSWRVFSRADQRRESTPTTGYLCHKLYYRRLDPQSIYNKDLPSAKQEKIKQ